MSLKAAVVVLVVIVALFVAALVIGANQEEGSATERNGLAERINERAGDPSAVAREDISATCVSDDDPNLLVFAGGLLGGCTIVVENDDQLKLVGLQAIDPITVEAPAPEGDLDVEDDVGAGEEVRVAVGEGRTEIDLSCGLAGSCSVRLDAE